MWEHKPYTGHINDSVELHPNGTVTITKQSVADTVGKKSYVKVAQTLKDMVKNSDISVSKMIEDSLVQSTESSNNNILEHRQQPSQWGQLDHPVFVPSYKPIDYKPSVDVQCNLGSSKFGASVLGKSSGLVSHVIIDPAIALGSEELVSKTVHKRQQNTKGENSIMKNKLFGKLNNEVVKFSLLGNVIRTYVTPVGSHIANQVYKTIKDGRLADVPKNFVKDVESYIIPAQSKDLKSGDIIINGEKLVFFKEIKDERIIVIDPKGSVEETLVEEINLFNNSFLRKVVTKYELMGIKFDNINFNNSDNTEINPFTALMMADDKSELSEILPLLMMQQGNNQNQTFNPMMLMMMADDKSELSEILPLLMMQQGGNNQQFNPMMLIMMMSKDSSSMKEMLPLLMMQQAAQVNNQN